MEVNMLEQNEYWFDINTQTPKHKYSSISNYVITIVIFTFYSIITTKRCIDSINFSLAIFIFLFIDIDFTSLPQQRR